MRWAPTQGGGGQTPAERQFAAAREEKKQLRPRRRTTLRRQSEAAKSGVARLVPFAFRPDLPADFWSECASKWAIGIQRAARERSLLQFGRHKLAARACWLASGETVKVWHD